MSENTDLYRIWKKNTPFLYDLVITHSLEWPSLTTQWLPATSEPEGKDHTVHRIILGTHTNDDQQNHLLIASVQLPNKEANFDDSQYDSDKGEFGGYGYVSGKIEIDVRINHSGEVNKARYCPQHPYVIATKSPCSKVYVFDYTKHPSTPSSDGECKPELILNGHTQEGFGLAWSQFIPGHILSAGYDQKICLWDISATTYDSRTLNPKTVYTGHSDKVTDVCWHQMHECIFGSVADDTTMMIWDTRTDSNQKALICKSHIKEVNCLSFNPFNPYIVATGSSDETVKFWDIRQSKTPFHTIKTSGVFQIDWSPHYETLLASSGTNNAVELWDLASKFNQLSNEELKYGPPELQFSHRGHAESVSEFSWNLNETLLICSVSEDNGLQIWQPSVDMSEHQTEKKND